MISLPLAACADCVCVWLSVCVRQCTHVQVCGNWRLTSGALLIFYLVFGFVFLFLRLCLFLDLELSSSVRLTGQWTQRSSCFYALKSGVTGSCHIPNILHGTCWSEPESSCLRGKRLPRWGNSLFSICCRKLRVMFVCLRVIVLQGKCTRGHRTPMFTVVYPFSQRVLFYSHNF